MAPQNIASAENDANLSVSSSVNPTDNDKPGKNAEKQRRYRAKKKQEKGNYFENHYVTFLVYTKLSTFVCLLSNSFP